MTEDTTTTSAAAVIRRPWLLMIMDHNPCYLLSGMCMLLGCGLLNWALYDRGGDVRKMLTLLAVVNVYELLLVGLGLLLIRKPSFLRDGRILLGLEAVFLTDITFINGVISTVSASAGLLTGLGLLVLASGKTWLVLRALKLPLANRMWVFVTVVVACVVLGPAVYKQVAEANRGFMKPLWIYLGWCAVGSLLVLGAMIWRWRLPVEQVGERPAERGIGWFYVVLAFASLLGHQVATGWVYSVAFDWVYLAPVVLGLAAVVEACRGWVVTPAMALRLQVAIVATAVWMSVGQPVALERPMAGVPVVFSPLRVALLGAAAVCLWLLWRDHRRMFAYAAAVCVMLAVLGPSALAMWVRVQEIAQATASTAVRLWPRTMLEWGVTAVGGSFVLLGVGAGWTAMRERVARRHREEVAAA